jgi:hypothetical protein
MACSSLSALSLRLMVSRVRIAQLDPETGYHGKGAADQANSVYGVNQLPEKNRSSKSREVAFLTY